MTDSSATIAHSPPDPALTIASPSPTDEATATVVTTVRLAASGAVVPGYEILGELGRGGMGVVYKARQVALNRQVALKMILAGSHAGDTLLARFKAEAEAIAKLQHPNIVQIYDIGECDGRPYFSLELVEGGSLERKIAGQPQNPRLAARIVEVLARAVHVAHEAGIVHRDLKPANILLQVESRSVSGGSSVNRSMLSASTEFGTPKITDFGLAKHLGASQLGQTGAGSIMGTPSYMSPEQAQGENHVVGPLTDVYALGAILYELLVGRPPFRADTPLNTIMEVIRGEAVPPRRVQSKTPRDLETIALKCLEKSPTKRYASALHLADDLQRYLDGSPIAARPAGSIERAIKWAKRRPTLAALVATIVIAGIALVSGGVWAYAAVTREAAEARQAQAAATAALEQARQRQVRLCVANGSRQLDAGDLLNSLVWFAEALRLDAGHADREQVHRKRLAAAIQHCPRLERVWRHEGAVTKAVFSPDGKCVATASADGMARIWDPTTGDSTLPLEQGGTVAFLEFSADGKKLLTGGFNGNAFLWDVASGQRLVTFPVGVALARGHILPGDRVVLATRAGGIRFWDGKTGTPHQPVLVHNGKLTDLAVDATGRLIVSASDDGIARLWDAAQMVAVGLPMKHASAINTVAFSPDGDRIATGCADGTTQVWNVRTGEPILARSIRQRGSVNVVVFSPDGTRVAAASDDKTAQVFDATTGMTASPQFRHGSRVGTVVFSPDGRWIATGSDDNAARIWDASSAAAIGPILRNNGTPVTVMFSPDGRSILTGSQDGLARLWRLLVPTSSGAQLTVTPSEGVRTLSSPDGKLMVAFGGESVARVRRASDREPVGPPLRHDSVVSSTAFSSDGKTIATGAGDGTVQLWDAVEGKTLWPEPVRHSTQVDWLAFSRDGKKLATASDDNTSLVLNAADGRPLFAPIRHTGGVYHVAFSDLGDCLFTASHDGTSRIWDAETGEPLTPPLPPWDGKPWRDELEADGRAAADLMTFAQVLSGLRVDEHGGQAQLPTAAIREAWGKLRQKYPADFTDTPGAARVWHEQRAAESEKAKSWFAAAWHLERLVSLTPAEADIPRRLARALGEWGSWERSAAAATLAIELSPGSWEAWQRRGQALGEL
ncbi:MAG: serine/threonine-protein kinase, partial [Gemmataceae bacterium]